jgi:hypothetical protein
MQIEREPLYDAYDRLTSEAELRFSIFPPLALLSVTAAVLWSPWCLVALVMPAILAAQGSRLYDSAQERVLQALTTGVVQSPTVQELHGLESVKRS